MSVEAQTARSHAYHDQAVHDLIDVLDRPAPVGRSSGVHPDPKPTATEPDHGEGHAPPDAALLKDVPPTGSRGANSTAVANGSTRLRNNESNAPVVEAVLLLEGHPATVARLSRITGLPIPEIERCLGALRARYAAPDYGLQITRVADSYSITPKAELWERLGPHYGNGSGKRLSRAAMETLTIVAYSQPVTRSQIEAMRGVSADAMIRLLCDRQLICPVGYQQGSVGRPTLFGTTNRFLETFGLETIDDLPKLDKVEEGRFLRT